MKIVWWKLSSILLLANLHSRIFSSNLTCFAYACANELPVISSSITLHCCCHWAMCSVQWAGSVITIIITLIFALSRWLRIHFSVWAYSHIHRWAGRDPKLHRFGVDLTPPSLLGGVQNHPGLMLDYAVAACQKILAKGFSPGPLAAPLYDLWPCPPVSILMPMSVILTIPTSTYYW